MTHQQGERQSSVDRMLHHPCQATIAICLMRDSTHVLKSPAAVTELASANSRAGVR